ncbi:MAG: membrane dipeptidase, partial [Alphaproteobacteria bacterium]|nr:membrane dipeptidase [Alphaproteobacteria bacterium]
AIGVDHVALGTDLNSTSGGFRNYGDLPKLADELLGVKFSEDEVGKMLGGNFLRVFRKVTAKNA